MQVPYLSVSGIEHRSHSCGHVTCPCVINLSLFLLVDRFMRFRYRPPIHIDAYVAIPLTGPYGAGEPLFSGSTGHRVPRSPPERLPGRRSGIPWGESARSRARGGLHARARQLTRPALSEGSSCPAKYSRVLSVLVGGTAVFAASHDADGGTGRRCLPPPPPCPPHSARPTLKATLKNASVRPAWQKAVKWAMSKRGTPYVWGGTGNGGFDCSGLMLRAYGAAGIKLPRSPTTSTPPSPRRSPGRISRPVTWSSSAASAMSA